MDLNIAGRRALVTGASSGIGFATARQLLAEGAMVFMTGRDPAKLSTAAARLDCFEGRLHAFPADITSDVAVRALKDAVARAMGKIDILVQCAGIHGARGAFHELAESQWEQTLAVDLIGQVRVLQAFLGDLRQGGWGRLVFVSSEHAVQPYADELPYCAAKAGLLALARGLARSYAGDGLLVNSVSPAFIATPVTDAVMDQLAEVRGSDRDEAVAHFLEHERPYMELGRRGKPAEVAAVIAFLCSDRASFVNGANYRVDAGSVATV